jgi:hypothetical protein
MAPSGDERALIGYLSVRSHVPLTAWRCPVRDPLPDGHRPPPPTHPEQANRCFCAGSYGEADTRSRAFTIASPDGVTGPLRSRSRSDTRAPAGTSSSNSSRRRCTGASSAARVSHSRPRGRVAAPGNQPGEDAHPGQQHPARPQPQHRPIEDRLRPVPGRPRPVIDPAGKLRLGGREVGQPVLPGDLPCVLQPGLLPLGVRRQTRRVDDIQLLGQVVHHLGPAHRWDQRGTCRDSAPW